MADKDIAVGRNWEIAKFLHTDKVNVPSEIRTSIPILQKRPAPNGNFAYFPVDNGGREQQWRKDLVGCERTEIIRASLGKRFPRRRSCRTHVYYILFIVMSGLYLFSSPNWAENVGDELFENSAILTIY